LEGGLAAGTGQPSRNLWRRVVGVAGLRETGLGGNGPAAQEVAALRDAVLRCREELLRPAVDRRRGWAWRWLDRLQLSWLTVPWILVDVVRAVASGRQPDFFIAHDGAARLYRELSGKDPGVAEAEVWRMLEQLGSLDERVLALDEDRPGRPAGADRAELEAAAGALAGYYLGGRRTDDGLLQQVEAAWTEVEELEARQRDEVAGSMLRRRNWERLLLSDEQEDQAADRYVAAWRRWLDRQVQQGASAGSDG
jgi:hypothetical protein